MGRKRFQPEKIVNKLREAEVLIERWRRHCNTVRPPSALGYRPPAPEAILPAVEPASAALQPRHLNLVNVLGLI